MLRYGVIGFGYWGPNLVRVFSRAPGSKVVAISDTDENKRNQALMNFPTAEVMNDPFKLIARPDIDVIAIATPVSTHYQLAKAALKSGKHIFVEKPLAARAAEAEELVTKAARRKLQIFVDHTFIYTGAIRKIKEVIQQGSLGNILYYDSVRVNLGLFQHDVNVLWDLAIHDISILDYILPAKPKAVSAMAVDPVGTQPASIGYLTLFYPSSMIAHIHASWLAPVKVRQTLIGGDKRMIVYNDLELSEKIRIYDKGIHFAKNTEEEYQLRVGYRSGDMVAPQLNTSEALAVAACHANECIQSGAVPITSGHMGCRVVRILEAADESVRSNGRIIQLDT